MPDKYRFAVKSIQVEPLDKPFKAINLWSAIKVPTLDPDWEAESPAHFSTVTTRDTSTQMSQVCWIYGRLVQSALQLSRQQINEHIQDKTN